MQKGSVALATCGLAFTLTGLILKDWLDYKPEGWQPQPGTDKQWGAPATVGLWQYNGFTMSGVSFS